MLDARLESQTQWFAITEQQEAVVASKVEGVRQRMEYASLMGRAPQLSVRCPRKASDRIQVIRRNDRSREGRVESQHWLHFVMRVGVLFGCMCDVLVAGQL